MRAKLLTLCWLLLPSLAGCGLLADHLESSSNPVFGHPPYAISEAAKRLHFSSFVADMHSDALLSGRDLLKPGTFGSVDLPRLKAGGIAFQTFTAPTHGPYCPAKDNCRPWPNLIGAWAFVSSWPISTLFSRERRALYYAQKLDALASRASPQVTVIRTQGDLARFLRQPAASRGLAALLGVEGSEALDSDITAIQRLKSAGFRMFGLVHQTDNEVAGSSQGRIKAGLSMRGRDVLAQLTQTGFIVDLAHASDQTVDDVTAVQLARPLIVSHAGVKAVCDVPRNLGDRQLEELIAAGAIIGIGYWDNVLCLDERATAEAFANAIAASIQHVIAIARQVRPGEAYDHVGLGSDFDGWVNEGFDSSGVPLITDALLRSGLADDQIRKILGGNYCVYLMNALPREDGASPIDEGSFGSLCGGT